MLTYKPTIKFAVNGVDFAFPGRAWVEISEVQKKALARARFKTVEIDGNRARYVALIRIRDKENRMYQLGLDGKIDGKMEDFEPATALIQTEAT